MINHGKQWQVWLASENRCHLLPPLAKPLTSWQRLLLMRAMGDRMLIKMATIGVPPTLLHATVLPIFGHVGFFVLPVEFGFQFPIPEKNCKEMGR